jgi:hypothetical protein
MFGRNQLYQEKSLFNNILNNTVDYFFSILDFHAWLWGVIFFLLLFLLVLNYHFFLLFFLPLSLLFFLLALLNSLNLLFLFFHCFSLSLLDSLILVFLFFGEVVNVLNIVIWNNLPVQIISK